MTGFNPRGALILAALVVLPPVIALAAGGYERRIMTLAGIYAIAVLGYQLVFGRLGALSLAQGCFFGLGAYTTGLLGIHFGWGFPLTFLASMVVPAALALVVAIPVLRLASHYFALATLGVSQVGLLIAVNWTDVTGGANGLYGVPDIDLFGIDVASSEGMLILVWAVVAAAVAGVSIVLRGRLSRRLSLLKSAPEAAAASGIDIGSHRLALFLGSAVLGGAAGALQAHSVGVVSPAVMEFQIMVTLLAMTVVGGRGHPAGAILGAVLLAHLPEWFRFLEGSYLIAYGAALLVAVIVLPEGLAGLFSRWLGDMEPNVETGASGSPAALARTKGAEGLSITGAAKRFGGLRAVDDISLSIAPGEIVGLIGPNGSGKTTLINIAAGAYAADRGAVRLGGMDLSNAPPHVRARHGLGRSFQSSPAIPELSPLGTVWAATDNRLAGPDAARHAARCIGFSGLDRSRSGPAAARDLDLARALAGDPTILLLDEPAAGLTPDERDALAKRLRGLADAGLGLLVVDHSMDFLLPLADRMVCLAAGKVVAEGTPEEVARDPAAIAAYFGDQPQ